MSISQLERDGRHQQQQKKSIHSATVIEFPHIQILLLFISE